MRRAVFHRGKQFLKIMGDSGDKPPTHREKIADDRARALTGLVFQGCTPCTSPPGIFFKDAAVIPSQKHNPMASMESSLNYAVARCRRSSACNEFPVVYRLVLCS